MAIKLICSIFIIAAITILNPTSVIANNNTAITSADVLQFCQNNGFKYLTFITTNRKIKESQRTLLLGLYRDSQSMQTFRSRLIKTDEYNEKQHMLNPYHQHEKDKLVLISSSNSEEWMHYIRMISKTKIRSSLLVITDPLIQSVKEEMISFLSQSSENTYFYLLYVNHYTDVNLTWERIITIRHAPKVVINEVEFNEYGMEKADYNMQGIHIKCSTLSWAPYLTLYDCNENDGKDCKSKGTWQISWIS